MASFEKRKKDCLGKLDKSNIGSWDAKIKDLCEKINNKNNLYTTSSCAGRIVLLKDEDKKAKNKFLFRTHDKISFSELKEKIGNVKEKDKEKGLIYFKQEPCILHVACDNLDDARDLLEKAKLVGWKRSGVMSVNKRFMLELMSTENIGFPIIQDGKLLVNDDFLKLVVKQSNKKLGRTWEKIQKLEKLI